MRRPGCASQVAAAAARRSLQALRSQQTVSTLLAFLVGGLVAGLVMAGGPLFAPPAPLQYGNSCPPDGAALSKCRRPAILTYQPAPFYITMILGSLAVTPAVRSFGSEVVHAWREAGVGASRSSYFAGVLCVDVGLWALSTLCFWGPILAVAPLRGPEGPFYAAFLAITAVCSSIGYALSAILGEKVDAATLIAVVGAVVMNLFGGFVPAVGTMGGWAYTHWAQRSLVSIELVLGYGLSPPSYNSVVSKEWAGPSWGADVGIMWGIAALTAALALACTLRCHRDRAR